MPTPDPSILNQIFIAFLAGDSRAGGAVYTQMSAAVLAVVRNRASDLVNDREDVLNERKCGRETSQAPLSVGAKMTHVHKIAVRLIEMERQPRRGSILPRVYVRKSPARA